MRTWTLTAKDECGRVVCFSVTDLTAIINAPRYALLVASIECEGEEGTMHEDIIHVRKDSLTDWDIKVG